MNQPQAQNPPSTSPAQNDQPSATPSTSEHLLQQLLSALAPSLDFHKTVETASDNDLRMFWDIRLVQGKDIPLTSLSGSSSFPGALAGSSVGPLPTILYKEIVEKVAMPLNSRIQDMITNRALEDVVRNVEPKQRPSPARLPDPAESESVDQPAAVEPDEPITAEELIDPSERTEAIDALLPAHLVEEAAGVLNKVNKS